MFREISRRVNVQLKSPSFVSSSTKEIINFIVNNVAQLNINIPDKEKMHTPLNTAAMYKRRTICRILISHGALVTCFDKDGLSPRLLALNSHDGDLAKYLQSQERLQLIAADDHETAV
jgi:ankyrin repeat protein